VLVMSNSLLFRAGLARLLQVGGISIVGEATNVQEALALLRSAPSDIILVDYDPDADRFARVEALVCATNTSRIIALSERNRPADHARLIECGVIGLVFKTDPPAVLFKAIRKVHAGEVWLDRANTAIVFRRMATNRRSKDVEVQKIETLTKREREIIALLGEGLKNAAMGERLFISESTVRNHLTSVFAKLNVEDRLGLVIYAFKHGLVRYTDLR